VTEKMPALPEAARFTWELVGDCWESRGLYTAAQMHAYATAAVLADREARDAAVAEDAGRYRWLRANKYAVGPHAIQFGQTDAYTVLHGDALDAAIDAAMKEDDHA
jgi:hypothetical protein